MTSGHSRSAIVPAPALINGDTMGIQWEVDAILQQDFGNNQFVPVDSLVVLQGEEPPVHSFSGPGGAKMNPDAGVNNSPFQPRTLSFVEFNPSDLLTVVSGSQAQYHLIAVHIFANKAAGRWVNW